MYAKRKELIDNLDVEINRIMDPIVVSIKSDGSDSESEDLENEIIVLKEFV